MVPQGHMITGLVQGVGPGREENQPGWTVHPRRGTERAGDEGHGDFGCGRHVAEKLSLADQRWILCVLLDFCYLKNYLYPQGSVDIG